MTELLLLAERVEGAEASEQAELLVDAYNAIKPHRSWVMFHRMLRAEAYESAALMLVPEPCIEGEYASVGIWTGPGVHASHVRATAWVSGSVRVLAATPALALTAACLRARHSMEGLS